MTTNARKQNKYTPYLLEVDGKQYGSYATEETALQIAMSMITVYSHHSGIPQAKQPYCVIRRGDEKVWEN